MTLCDYLLVVLKADPNNFSNFYDRLDLEVLTTTLIFSTDVNILGKMV